MNKMSKITIGSIINTSIITAFTIATALIWKDVIEEIIHLLFPGEELIYKLYTAIIATIIIVIVIYVILKAQKETKGVLRLWKRKKRRK